MQDFINSVRNFLSENSNKDKTVISSETTNLTESENLKKMQDEAEKASAAANAIKHTVANHKQAAALHDKAFHAHNKLYTHHEMKASEGAIGHGNDDGYPTHHTYPGIAGYHKKLADHHDAIQSYHYDHAHAGSHLKQHNANLSYAKRAKTPEMKKHFLNQAKSHLADFKSNTETHEYK